MQPRQSGRRIFLRVFYPLLITKGAIFKHFIDDLRQFPHMRLILVALFACLTTLEQIVQRISSPIQIHQNQNLQIWPGVNHHHLIFPFEGFLS